MHPVFIFSLFLGVVAQTPSPSYTVTSSPTSLEPTYSPTTLNPTSFPTEYPSATPNPTQNPITASPTFTVPTASLSPTFSTPTQNPVTESPTPSPASQSPTQSPTHIPTKVPTTRQPTLSPVTQSPTRKPTTGVPTTAAPTYKSVSGAFKFMGSQTDPNGLGLVDISDVVLVGETEGTVQVAAYFSLHFICEKESRFVCENDTIATISTEVEDLNGTSLTVLGLNLSSTLQLKHHGKGKLIIPQFISGGPTNLSFELNLVQNPICPDNFWACNGTVFCCPCPAGGSCMRGGFPQALNGFIKVNNTFFLQCTPEGACSKGMCVNPPYTNEARACDTCVQDYYRKDQICMPCPSTAKLVLAVGVFFFLFALLVILKLAKTSDMNSFSFTISLGFIQLISIYATLPFSWPEATTVMFDVLSFTNFNVDLFSPECAVASSYWSKWVLKLMLPVIAIVLFSGLYLLVKKVEAARSFYIAFLLFSPVHWFLGITKLRDKRMLTRLATLNPTGTLTAGEVRAAAFQWEEENLSCRFIAAVTQCATVLYTFLAKTTTDPLNCIQQTDGSLILRADPSVPCYDDTWNSHAVLMALGFGLYIIGIPTYFFVVLFRAFRSNTLDSNNIYYRYGALVLPYRTQFWYWESVQMARKLVTVMLINFGAGRYGTASTAQINGMVLALLLFLAMQEFVKPYQIAWCNRVAFSWTIASVLVLVSALLFQKKVLTSAQEDGYAAGLIAACIVAAVVSFVCFAKEKAHARAMRLELQGTHRLDREKEERKVLTETFGSEVGQAVFRKARSLSAKNRTAFMGKIARISSGGTELTRTQALSPTSAPSESLHSRLILKFGPRVGHILSNTLDTSTQYELLEDSPEPDVQDTVEKA